MREHYHHLLEEAKLEAAKLEIVAKIIDGIDSPLDPRGLDPMSVEFELTSNDKDFTIEVSRWTQPASSSKESLVPLKETWRRITVSEDGSHFSLLLRDGSAEYITARIGKMATFTLEATLQNLQLFKEASEIVKTQLN